MAKYRLFYRDFRDDKSNPLVIQRQYHRIEILEEVRPGRTIYENIDIVSVNNFLVPQEVRLFLQGDDSIHDKYMYGFIVKDDVCAEDFELIEVAI